MIPILYKSAEVEFTTNGLGLLNDIYSVDIQEQRNGLLTLTASYPTNAKHYKEIETGRIIYAKPNPLDGAQAFRIVKTELDISGYNLNIEADHITYDLTHNLVKEVHLQGDGQNAMTHLQNATVTPHLFRFVSDLQHLGDSSLQYVNPMEAIAGTEGSILQIWGGELHRDNRTVSMLSRRGRDNFTTFRLGKNINGLKYTVDMSNVTTRIVPTVTKSDATDNDKAYFVVGDTVDSKNLNKYPNVYIQHVDMGEKVTINEGETDEQIKAKIDKQAKNWFTKSANTGIDLPQVTVEIDVTSLQDSADYQEKFRNLESVGLTDTVSVYVPEFNVNVTAIVNELHYDPVAERVTSLVVGTSKKSFADNNSNALAELQNSITQIRQDATTAIVSSNGKNTNYYGTEEPAHPVEGDLWFKQVGDETYLMIFKDGRWQEWVSTKTQEEIAKKVDDAVKKAKEYTDELNEKQASEAAVFQSEANAALSSAAAERTVFSSNASSMATSAATHADSMADSAATYAKAQAASALSSANSALTTAKSDLTTAIGQETEDRNKAVSAVSSQAQDYATQAKSDAIDASKTADGQVRKDFKVTTDSLSSTISQNKEDSDGKISTAQSTATQALNGLKTKVSQTDYNAKTGKLQTDLTTTSQTANQAKSDIVAIKSEADSQSAQINDIVSDAKGTKQTISDIKTEQGKQSGSIATLQSRADGFESTVTKVNNLAVGGRNLIKNGDIMYSWVGEHNVTTNDGAFIYTQAPFAPAMYQIEVRAIDDSIIGADFGWQWGGELQGDIIKLTTDWQKASALLEFNKAIGLRVRGGLGLIELRFVKAETGNLPTDWTPAPEDLSSATAKAQLTADKANLDLSTYKKDADGRISKAQSDITATAKEVKAKVSQSDYDAKTDDLTTKYGQVKATADAVTTDVAKYKKSNDGKVSANEANITTLNNQITSKVNQTDFDKTTGELSGNYTETKQTVKDISNTVTELQAKANAQGQINQLVNTEFSPDTEGWTLSADKGSNAPYASFATYGSRGIGFNTVNADTNTFARLSQTILLPSTRLSTDVMSLSWRVNTRRMDNYCHIWLVWQDENGVSLGKNTMGHWNDSTLNKCNVLKWGNISIPIEAKQVSVRFESREGTQAYIFQPMLTFEKVVGDYVQGNYNNNARVAALEVDLDSITGLVTDPKKGLSATAALAANGLSVATTAQNDATTAIQTAKGVQTKVEQMGGINLLINTEFNPDLEGWELTSDGGDTKLPYRSYLSKDINATTVGFNTMNSATSSWSTMSQRVQLSSTATSGTTISLSWSSWAREVANYNGLHILFYDNKDTKVGDEYREWTARGGGGTENSYAVRKKWENITVPDTATYLVLKFQAREGTGAYLAQPMLVFGPTIGEYVAGPYNNNNSLESTRTQLAGQITDEIEDRKSGDSSVVTQVTGLIDQRVKSVERGYESAISQSANTIMASVSMPNQLLNTEFNPDLEGWDTSATSSGSRAPYRSYWQSNIQGTVVGFNTTSSSAKTYARLQQTVQLPSTPTSGHAVSMSWYAYTGRTDNYNNLWVRFYDNSNTKLSELHKHWADVNGNNPSGQNSWNVQNKWEHITVPDTATSVKVSFEAREGTQAYLGHPMLVFGSTVGTYTAGSYSGMNTSTVLELFKDNWAVGIADNADRIISGINGDRSGTVIQGKKLIVNSDTTINGKAFIDGSVIKNASIGTAQIGKAAVGSAQIINVDVSKISGNVANFITGNINTLNSHVLYGDTGHLNTTDTGRVINKRDNHLQLASKGMYNSANDRAQVELLSHTNDIDANMQGSFNYYSDVRKGHGLGIRLVQNQILAIDEDRGSKNLYLSPYAGGQVRIVSRDLSTYYDIAAANFRVSSQRKFKKNIQSLEDGALDIVKNTQIRQYEKNGNSEIGVIADEADKRLLSDDGKFINIYDYTSVLYKAVQELIEEVEKLKNGKSNSE